MHRYLQIVVALFAFAAASMAQATAQFADVIVLDGKEFALTTNPLAAHLAEIKWTPPKDAQIGSANWRGYIATWAIEDARLTLKDVTIQVDDGAFGATKSIRNELFAEQATVTADWYSGALIVPDGEMTNYVHMGYGSDYAHYQVIRIAAGQVAGQRAMTGSQFQAYKTAKFAEFVKTDEYREAHADMRKGADSLSEEQVKEFIMSFYAEQYLSK